MSGKLYLLFSDTCGLCMEFKAFHLSSFETYLESKNIKKEIIESKDYPYGDYYPSVLKEKAEIYWRPEFIWVPTGSEKNITEAKVYNGALNHNGKWNQKDSIRPLTTNSLISWLNEIGLTSSNPQLIPVRRLK